MVVGVAIVINLLIIWDKWQTYRTHKANASLQDFRVLFKVPWLFVKPDLFHEIQARDQFQIPVEFYKSKNRKSPLLIFFFGGGFMNNDQSQNRVFLDRIRRLGFHVASVGYRQLPGFPWPSSLYDTEDAVRELMRSAWPDMEFESFHLMGRSAGGFMALQTSLLSFEKPVKTCTAIYPVIDPKLWSEEPVSNLVLNSEDRVRLLVKGNWDLAKEISLLRSSFEKPVRYFLISGDSDPVVDVRQTLLLQEHLKKLGKEAQTIILKTETHGFDFNPYSWATQLLFERCLKMRIEKTP